MKNLFILQIGGYHGNVVVFDYRFYNCHSPLCNGGYKLQFKFYWFTIYFNRIGMDSLRHQPSVIDQRHYFNLQDIRGFMQSQHNTGK